jgi:hypothetical protein
MATRKYNPKKITGSYKGSIGARQFAIQFVGFMDGTFLTADYDEDAVTKHVGSQGDATFVLNANRGASVTLMLVQGSPTNDQLSDLVPNAKLNYMPVGVLTIKDLNGTTEFESADAVIKRRAKVEFGKEVTGREWVFDCGDADIYVGSGEEV